MKMCGTLETGLKMSFRASIGDSAEMHSKLKAEVRAELIKASSVTLAYDGWEDHTKCPILACAITPQEKVYLVDFRRGADQETGDYLAEVWREVAGELRSLGINVWGCGADNAALTQKGMVQAHTGLSLTHSMNLCLSFHTSVFTVLHG